MIHRYALISHVQTFAPFRALEIQQSELAASYWIERAKVFAPILAARADLLVYKDEFADPTAKKAASWLLNRLIETIAVMELYQDGGMAGVFSGVFDVFEKDLLRPLRPGRRKPIGILNLEVNDG